MKRIVEIILMDSEAEYQVEYVDTFVHGSHHLHGVPVVFSADDFGHIFSEPKDGRREFSFQRARRMAFMRELLRATGLIEMCYESDTGNIALFSTELDCVMYLRIRPATRSLQVSTFFYFGRDHSKMYKKQRVKCVGISVDKLKEAVFFGPTTS